MARSGMCTGRRVRHHLQHNLGREDSSIVFVGCAAVGTLWPNVQARYPDGRAATARELKKYDNKSASPELPYAWDEARLGTQVNGASAVILS
jgi:Cft2 family RNA processing exonuclease